VHAIADVMTDLDPDAIGKLYGNRRDARFNGSEHFAIRKFSRNGSRSSAHQARFRRMWLLNALKKKHEQDRIDARAAIREFDRKQWRAWRR